jgi:peptidyl-prolyl cis-trans isomerase C
MFAFLSEYAYVYRCALTAEMHCMLLYAGLRLCGALCRIELELAAGTLGGLFTTVEGLLSQARDHLTKSNPLAFTMGDAASSPSSLYQAFVKRLDACIGGTEQFTFVLRDPTGNSYVQALDESDEGWGVTDQAKRGVQRGMQAPTESGVDPRLTRAYFTRTLEEEDELGLADMRTDLGEDGDWKAPASLERSAKERRDALEKAQGGNMVACGPSRARVSHLLVEDETACVELKRQLDERGVGAFSELAASQSICPSAKQSGLLGSFSPGKMVAAFDAVVFSASVGEVHGPVHTQFGYHLILIHERHDGDDAASATLRPSD